jgi:hypothetical protein
MTLELLYLTEYAFCMNLSPLWQFAESTLRLPVALAQSNTGGTPSNDQNVIQLFDPLQGTSLTDLLEQILSGLTVLAIPVVSIMVMIGAYYIITSGGNPGNRQKGLDYIKWAAIGFAILLLATSVAAIVKSIIE